MRKFRKLVVLLVLPLFAFTTAHKFYVSVTHVSYSEKDKAIQIKSRIFIDDLEEVLRERYGINTELDTDQEGDQTDAYLEKYWRKKFKIAINGSQKEYTLLGRKYDTDVCIFYLEVPDVTLANVSSIEIQNEILTDLFDEQQNLLHFKIGDKKKSFVLLKTDTKGMLNF